MKISFVSLTTVLLLTQSFVCDASTVIVPNVVNETQAAAQNAITAAGLVVGTISQYPSNTIVAGNIISENPAAGTSVNSGSAVNLVVSIGSPQFLPTGQNNAVSNVFSAQNGTIGSTSLPAGQNEAVSNVFSAQNGTIGSLTLPAGQNEAVSNVFSAQNGTLGSTSLPAGQNEVVSNVFSAQNGTIGSPTLPAGQNEAVSDLISASMNDSGSAIPRLQTNSTSVNSGTSSGASSASLQDAVLMAGQTVTIASSVPAQISLNGVRAGNDPGSNTNLTFVVPTNLNAFKIRAGAGPDSSVTVQTQTRTLTGLVLSANGAPEASAAVQLRHQGSNAEFFKLPPNALKQDFPSLAELKPVAEIPVSSLNLHDPKSAFGYFPVGDVAAPDFAVRFSGEVMAATSGAYSFYVAAAEGAQLTIDGVPQPVVLNAVEGLERAVPVKLAQGWHSLQLIVYAEDASAETIVSYAPPNGVKQLIPSDLLRASSNALVASTGQDGKFAITVPAWLDRVEAIATSPANHASVTSEPIDSQSSAFAPIRFDQ